MSIRNLFMGAGARLVALFGTPTKGRSSTTSLVINKPTGVVAGHLLVALNLGGFTGGNDYTGAAGWTEVYDRGPAGGLRLAHYLAGASEGASYTFTATNNNEHAGAICAFSGAVFDVVGEPSTALVGGVLSAPSITVTQPNSLLLAIYGNGVDGTTFTTPTGMTPLVSEGSAVKPSFAIFYQFVAAGATGVRASTFIGTTTNPIGILMSLKPS